MAHLNHDHPNNRRRTHRDSVHDGLVVALQKIAALCFMLVVSLDYHKDDSTAFAFTTPSYHRKHDHCGTQEAGIRPSASLLFAKLPSFDLDALEEYEQSLLLPDHAAADDDDGDVEEEEEEATRYTVTPDLDNTRIDVAVAALLRTTEETVLSRSTCGTLVSDGRVSLLQDGTSSSSCTVITRKSEKVRAGQILVVQDRRSSSRPTEILPENIPLNVLYEDEHMIVVNKAAGMVVHPAAGNWDGTLVNALAYYLAHESPYGTGEFVGAEEHDEKDAVDGETVYFRPGIVHRLDKGTTGIIIVAKTKEALTNLSASFAQRKVRKTYVAITVGNPGKRVVIDKPIGRHPIHRQKMRVVPDPGPDRRYRANTNTGAGRPSPSVAGRRALSFVDTEAFDGKLSVVRVRIETGRTHQIRVHLQDRHTPIYGDDVYGLPDWNRRLHRAHGMTPRPLLHAHRLEIAHPVRTHETMVFVAPLAEDMARVTDTVWPQGRAERAELFACPPP